MTALFRRRQQPAFHWRAASKRQDPLPADEDPGTALRPGFIARPQPAVVEVVDPTPSPSTGWGQCGGGSSYGGKMTLPACVCSRKTADDVREIGDLNINSRRPGGGWERWFITTGTKDSQRTRRGRRGRRRPQGDGIDSDCGPAARGRRRQARSRPRPPPLRGPPPPACGAGRRRRRRPRVSSLSQMGRRPCRAQRSMVEASQHRRFARHHSRLLALDRLAPPPDPCLLGVGSRGRPPTAGRRGTRHAST